jgi:hypothetical protein
VLPGASRSGASASGRSPLTVLFGAVIAGVLGFGAWCGFPVQDDAALIRLLRFGGPSLVLSEEKARRASAFLIATCARLAGQRKLPYILAAVVCWLLMALVASRLWAILFPEWARVWPVVALATVSPVLTRIQFTTVSTLFPVVIPVLLSLGALAVVLSRPDDRVSPGARALAVLMACGAGLLSEYALATVAAAAALCLVLRRWRSALCLLGGVAVGYLVFRHFGDVSIRPVTDPATQWKALLSSGPRRPFQLLSAVWYAVFGGWGQVVAQLHFERSSPSTLVAPVAGLGIAILVLRLGPPGQAPRSLDPGRRAVALLAAVAAGLLPAILIEGWPLHVVYETRFFLPVAVFAVMLILACCLGVAAPGQRPHVVLAIAFVAATRLVNGAFEERNLQRDLERFGQRVVVLVRSTDGLVLLVSPDRTGQSGEEVMAKATYPWSTDEAKRFWVMRPAEALDRLGPRSVCRSLSSLRLPPPTMGWPRPEERIAAVLWEPAGVEAGVTEPYYLGQPCR